MKPSAAVLSVVLALGVLAAPVPSPGQQPGKVYRIGYLGNSGPAPTNSTPHQCPIKSRPDGEWQAFVEGLRAHGYILGQNLVIECRYTEGRAERAPGIAADLVSLKPDLIVTVSGVITRAVKQATTEIPILMVNAIDPVRRGLVTSLAHPGGNVTGLTGTPIEMEGKRLQLLKEAVPKVSRVAVLTHPSAPPGPPGPSPGQGGSSAGPSRDVTAA